MMARIPKKESACSLDERLMQKLVPSDKQPYDVPNNWCWTTVGSINEYSGRTFDPLKTPDSWFELYSVPSSAEDYPEIVQGFEIGSTKQEVQKHDILLCKINPRINRVWYVHQHTDHKSLGSSEWIVVRNARINSRYLMWCFRSRYFREYMLSNVSGVGGSLMRAQPKYVQDYPIPLPPLAEQQRIVERIESLFAKLDEAKEKAQSVLDSFETRKAAILHKAFTGELTAKWRAEHNVTFEGEELCLIDVFRFIDYRGMTPDKTDSGVPLITAKNIKKGYIDYRINEYISYETYLQRQGRGVAHRNDILFTTEAPLGNVALADRDIFSTAQRVIVLQLREPYRCKIDNKYVMFYMLDEKFQAKLAEQKTGSTVAGIKAAKLKLITISLPCIDEQFEIVSILEDLFVKEQQAKEAAEAVLDQIDLLKKTILAHAFRGELGTNDPTEESAIELLKKVIN